MIRSIDPLLRWWRHSGHGAPEAHKTAAAETANGGAEQGGHDATQRGALELARPKQAPWLRRLDEAGVPRSLAYPSTTLGHLLDQTADRWGHANALVYSDKSWTYSQLLADVNRVAGGLARLGVRRGDRVLMTLPNCPEYVFCFFAVQKLGAIIVNAGPLMGADDLQSTIALTAPRVVIGLDLQGPMLTGLSGHSSIDHFVWVTLQSYQPVFKRLGYQLKLWHERYLERNHHADAEARADAHVDSAGSAKAGIAQHQTLKHLMENAPARPPTVAPDPAATAVLQPTGGTTGTLKLVQLSHRGLIANAVQICVWSSAMNGQERFIAVLPMFHVYGLTTCLIGTVYCGAQILMMTRFNAAQVIELVRQYHPTIFPLVPAMCDALSDALTAPRRKETRRELRKEAPVEHPAAAGSAMSASPAMTVAIGQPPNEKAAHFASLRLCISGAAPLPREMAERFTRLTGVTVVEGYGLTEASPVTHVNPPRAARSGSIGIPMPDTDCRLVDLDDGTTDVLGGEPGELLVCGPQVMSGYFSNPTDTRQSLTVDASGRTWLHTGDVMRVDDDGYFFVCDRKKDMIIHSGLKIYPLKVEKAIKAHDRVADVGVVGVPDTVHTENVVAFIVPSPGVKDLPALAEELRKYCRQHLAPYEVPASFQFVERLPRTGLGKLQRSELRKMPLLAAQNNETFPPETPALAISTTPEAPVVRPEFPGSQNASRPPSGADAPDMGGSSGIGSGLTSRLGDSGMNGNGNGKGNNVPNLLAEAFDRRDAVGGDAASAESKYSTDTSKDKEGH